MRPFIYSLILIAAAAGAAFGQSTEASNAPVPKRYAARPEAGFAYPYYLYVPASLRTPEELKKTHAILVLPNNSGKSSDDPDFQEADVKEQLKKNVHFADRLGVVLLEPVFPRPASDWQIYTHALDRDSMLTEKKEYRRFDLQLVAMIDDARRDLRTQHVRTEKPVLLLGFSASGMFVNRFTFLHPTRVKAAAIGSPGGWLIAPVPAYKGRDLRYPIGIGDIKAVAGDAIDLKALRRVPLFLFLGDQDTNDSVVFRDSYEKEDEDLIFELFGKTPVERWPISKELYTKAGLNAEFHLYPNIAHTINKDIADALFEFLRKNK